MHLTCLSFEKYYKDRFVKDLIIGNNKKYN